jgi:8-oxo-dGTP diphosphatase
MRPRFVDALLFDPLFKFVVLIRKTKPAWQAGKLNCVGGKIEPGETPEEAVRREFCEETGLDVPVWYRFLDLDLVRDNGELICFYSVGNVGQVETTTEETVTVQLVDMLMLRPEIETIPNLRWMVQMALSFAKYGENIEKFVSREVKPLAASIT